MASDCRNCGISRDDVDARLLRFPDGSLPASQQLCDDCACIGAICSGGDPVVGDIRTSDLVWLLRTSKGLGDEEREKLERLLRLYQAVANHLGETGMCDDHDDPEELGCDSRSCTYCAMSWVAEEIRRSE